MSHLPLLNHNVENNNYSKLKIIVSSIGQCVGGIGQAIFLPIFINTFSDNTNGSTGSYFVFFMMSALFIIPFGLLSLMDYYFFKTLTIDMIKSHLPTLIKMGICDAFNGLMVVYTVSLGRTRGDLQAVLLQLMIPVTFLLSKIYTNINIFAPEYTESRVGIYLVLIGMIIISAPNIYSIFNNTDNLAKNIIYPGIFTLAVIPGAFMNVIQHRIFNDKPNYNKNWMLLMESVFQFITAMCLFWVDFSVPYMKTSDSYDEFSDNFEFGFKCFFNPNDAGGKCNQSWVYGLLFALSYCLSYWTSSTIIQQASANLSAMLSAIIAPIQMFVWYFSPDLNAKYGGDDYTHIEIILGIIGIIFILPGSFIYHRNEKLNS